MDLLIWIVAFSLIGGLLSVGIASSFLLLSEKARNHMVPHLVSFAIGALLGASFLGLIPHAIEHQFSVEAHELGLTLLLGLLLFFVLEKMVLWRHCHSHHGHEHIPELGPDHHSHDGHHHAHGKAAGTLILVGDTIHNFVDGILIAAAFLTDVHLGIVTALAIAAHEIPQELGDFVILLHSGYSRSKALYFNMLSSLGTVLGAVLAYFLLSDLQHLLPYVLIVAASSFIYVAVADLIPGLHSRVRLSETLQQILLIAAGVVFIYFAHSTLH
ncbi:ZIP family metal transporter [Methylophaga sp. OBS3]|uniref:ZIP family metal transporter n=1 Tax=Methylophaga sp. OBS3 TaxID=2991934 RepID=UPI002251CD3A|nr:ZIP family metal transporter [Methylophaga sp. OBS3]MCX4190741.1 ZIP family metal transporter [Methylophaga sp. OBS3]